MHFVDHYLSPAALDELIGDADVVVLPYESSDQATSGVLAEAVAARIPVVSTGFPHAIELLSDGSRTAIRSRWPLPSRRCSGVRRAGRRAERPPPN